MIDILLTGVIPEDANGKERAFVVLDRFQPNIVALGFSKEYINFVDKIDFQKLKLKTTRFGLPATRSVEVIGPGRI